MPTLDLAFVTSGDDRPLIDNRDPSLNATGVHSFSEVWQLRAADLRKEFDGVTLDPLYPVADDFEIATPHDIHDAFFLIDGLPADVTLRNVFFLGHGSDSDGYIFSGSPTGPGQLDAFDPTTPDTRLMLTVAEASSSGAGNPNFAFLRRLEERLAPGYNVIWFLSCFTGAGELPAAVAKLFTGHGRKEFIVGAYENFYNTQINGQLGGHTTHNVTINGTGHAVRARIVNRFNAWNDEIVDEDTGSTVAAAPALNKIPRFQVTDGHGQASVLAPLDIV